MSEERRKRAKVTRLTDLEVWRRSRQLFLDVLTDLEQQLFLDVLADLEYRPSARPAVLARDQVLHSIGSIGANIAEGFHRGPRKYRASLDAAAGQACEAENWLCKARDVHLIDRDTAAARIRESIEIQKMLRSEAR